MKPVSETTLQDYNTQFIRELNNLRDDSKKNTESKKLLQEALETHIPKMYQLIDESWTTKGFVSDSLLHSFDWSCYLSIYAFNEQANINKQNYYVDLAISTAHIMENHEYIAEAWTNKCLQTIQKKDPYLLRQAVVSFKQAVSNVNIWDRTRFNRYLSSYLENNLYKQDSDIDDLLDGLESTVLIEQHSKARLTMYDQAKDAAQQNIHQRKTLDELIDDFERNCTLKYNQ